MLYRYNYHCHVKQTKAQVGVTTTYTNSSITSHVPVYNIIIQGLSATWF